MTMLDERTLLSLLLLERLAGPRAATRMLLLLAAITAAPALLLGVWLCGSLAWQWGSRTWDDMIHRASRVAQGPAPATDVQTTVAQLRPAAPTKGVSRAAALPRRLTAVRDALLVRDHGEPSEGRNTCLWALHTVIGLDEPHPQVRGRTLTEGQLEWLEAACHAPAMRVGSGPAAGAPVVRSPTLEERLYGSAPAAFPTRRP
jgi:hypothetical protein